MAAISNTSTNWKQDSIERASSVSDFWDVVMSWLGHFAVPTLTVSMFVSIAGMFPGVSYATWFSSALLLVQVIFLDIGGLSLKALAQDAHDRGLTLAARSGKRMSYFLISLMIATIIVVTINQVSPIAGSYAPLVRKTTSYIDISLILARVISIVIYLNVVHGLKAHSPLAIKPTPAPTPHLHSERIDQLETTINRLNDRLTSILAESRPTYNLHENVERNVGYVGLSTLPTCEPTSQIEESQESNVPLIAEKSEQALQASVAQYPVVPGVSERKVKELVDAHLSGIEWSKMRGNYSQTVKPVKEAFFAM